jgi:hypothetical protein
MKIPNDYMFVAEIDYKDVYFDAYKEDGEIDISVLHVVDFDEEGKPFEYEGDFDYFESDCVEYLEKMYEESI